MRPWPAITSPSPSDQHRHRPAELRHRGGDLRDLVGAHGSWRSGHRASGARAATSRCAPERSSGSWVSTCGRRRQAGGFPVVDSRLDSTGPRWTPSGSSGIHPRKAVSLCCVGGIWTAAGGFRTRVASQKFAAVASELARSAPRHTLRAGKDPRFPSGGHSMAFQPPHAIRRRVVCQPWRVLCQASFSLRLCSSFFGLRREAAAREGPPCRTR